MSTQINALKVHQWSPEWDSIRWDAESRQAEPSRKHFFLFAIEARTLKRLTGIHRRSTTAHQNRAEDLGIQRYHDQDRSNTIRDFVRFGYPWSELPPAKRRLPTFDRFRKPGWLPTGIIVNILGPSARRTDGGVASSDLITISDIDESSARLQLPEKSENPAWEPSALHPIEVIDGQHRLWAFEENAPPNYELPVIAFYDLDISWQAYLFWSVNITPKRINRSLAFDLYPLLRTEDWLDESLGAHRVYRETRAQELVETLYAHPKSAWYRRINMLGQTKLQSGDSRPLVSQNAWINSLLATLIKNWEPARSATGGLFGSQIGGERSVLQWNKSQQAAFLIFVWREVASALEKTEEDWARSLRSGTPTGMEPFFENPYSLLTTDQGVRGVLAVFNDLCYVDADRLILTTWRMSEVTDGYDEATVSDALNKVATLTVAGFVREIALALTKYDWRTSSASGLTEDEKRAKTALRGGSGYKILRTDLLRVVADGEGRAAAAAKRVLGLEARG